MQWSIDSNGWSARPLARELATDNSGVIRALATMQAEVAAAAVSEWLTRSEVAEFVQAVKAKRLAPAPPPEPATIDIGDGVVVTIRWKKACPVGAVQALRKALKMIQEREKPEQAA